MQTTSAIFSLTMGIKIRKSAVFYRLKTSKEWLRWMSKELCEKESISMPKPEFLEDKNVILVDANDEAVCGSKKSNYSIHYAFDLFQFTSREIELTPTKQGEKLSRYRVLPNDIFIADRSYCTMTGIEHVLSGQGDFILRFRANAFNLYNENGDKIDLLSHMRYLNEYESADIRCFYKLASHELRPIRIVAMKKDKVAMEEAKRKMLRNSTRKQRNPAKDATMEINVYIVLITSLDYTNAQILELYRAPWQIEQVFYRLKSLYQYDDISCKTTETAQTWFYGKLLLSALCEKLIKNQDFFPSNDWKEALCNSYRRFCNGEALWFTDNRKSFGNERIRKKQSRNKGLF